MPHYLDDAEQQGKGRTVRTETFSIVCDDLGNRSEFLIRSSRVVCTDPVSYLQASCRDQVANWTRDFLPHEGLIVSIRSDRASITYTNSKVGSEVITRLDII